MIEHTQPTRRIYSSKTTSNAEIRELLQAVFVSELLLPSESLWLVSPWMTDVEMLDNRGGSFSSLLPTAGLRQIRLSEILATLLDRTKVNIVARPDEHNAAFVAKLEDLAHSLGLDSSLRVLRRDTLHLKGLLGGDYYVSGSMNLTYSGIEINEEEITFERSPDQVSTARIHFEQLYGGSQ